MGEARIEHAADLRRRAETHLISAGWLSARELMEDALVIYRDEGDRGGEIACLRGLGEVASKLGEYDAAGALYDEALIAARAAGNRLSEGECLFRDADRLRALDDADSARQRFGEAAAAYAAAGHRQGEARCLGLLGEIARQGGAPKAEVVELYQRAQSIQMEVGDLKGAAVTWTFIANYLKEVDPGRAADAFVQAAKVYEGLGLHHRAEPFFAAARRLDPDNVPAPSPRKPGPWDSEDD